MHNTYSTQKGFTLVELMAVIAIVGILSGVVFAGLSGARERARDAERVSDIAQIQLALELFFNACREYPASLAVGEDNGGTCTNNLGVYINPIPTDPLATAYSYGTNGSDTDYLLGITLETNDRVLADDIDTSAYGVACAGALEYCVAP